MTSFTSLWILVAVHLFGNQSRLIGWIWHGRFLSFASGVSFGYVFVDLLPSLSEGQSVIKETFNGALPFLDKHAYLIALIGLLFTYSVETKSTSKSDYKFWLSMGGYALFNFFVGASLADPLDKDVKPIWLFTIAMGLHYFVRDHNAVVAHPNAYKNEARWILVMALILGWIVGYLTDIPQALIALVVAFVSGGVILNSMRYELPEKKKDSTAYFILGALGYSILLLSIGEP